MNRAWIPAGALAGVSVAGLLALGPLTDPMGTPVSFPHSFQVPTPSTKPASVPVSVSVGHPVGTTETAALRKTRGGQAGRTASTTNSDNGEVALKILPSSHPSSTHATVTQTVTPPPAKPKKAAKRPTSIGGTSETNGDSGLAGGSKGTTSLGEQSSTPSGNGP